MREFNINNLFPIQKLTNSSNVLQESKNPVKIKTKNNIFFRRFFNKTPVENGSAVAQNTFNEPVEKKSVLNDLPNEHSHEFCRAVRRDISARDQSTPRPDKEIKNNLMNSYHLPELVLSSNFGLDNFAYKDSLARDFEKVSCDVTNRIHNDRVNHARRDLLCISPLCHNHSVRKCLHSHCVSETIKPNTQYNGDAFCHDFLIEKCCDGLQDIDGTLSTYLTNSIDDSRQSVFRLHSGKKKQISMNRNNITDDLKAVASLGNAFPTRSVHTETSTVPVNDNLKVSVYDHSKLMKNNCISKLSNKALYKHFPQETILQKTVVGNYSQSKPKKSIYHENNLNAKYSLKKSQNKGINTISSPLCLELEDVHRSPPQKMQDYQSYQYSIPNVYRGNVYDNDRFHRPSSLRVFLNKEMLPIEEMDEDTEESPAMCELPQVREDPIGEDSCDFRREANKMLSFEEHMVNIRQKEWFWGPITRLEAEKKLEGMTDGTFLVRKSANGDSLVSLSFRSQKKSYHTRITYSNGLFSLCRNGDLESSHVSLQTLIDSCISSSKEGVCFFSTPNKKGKASFCLKLTTPLSRLRQIPKLQQMCQIALHRKHS